MGFPAKTSTGAIVNIVSKTEAEVPMCVDEDGNTYKAVGHVLFLVEEAPEAGVEPASEPESDKETYVVGNEGDEVVPVSTDDDPLGNPLTVGEEVATAEGVASGDPVPDDAAPIESDEWV